MRQLAWIGAIADSNLSRHYDPAALQALRWVTLKNRTNDAPLRREPWSRGVSRIKSHEIGL